MKKAILILMAGVFLIAAKPITVPVSPSGLIAGAISSSQINLSWTDNSGNETGFKIERKTGAGGTYLQIASTGANIAAYSDTGLTAGTTYYYRVRAYNSNGDSAYSNEVNAATLASPPTSPSGLIAAAISSSQINLSWTDNSGNETGFKIERKTGSGGTYQQVATAGANITAYSDTGLTAGTTYYYRVRAYNANGDSAYSNEANAATLASPPTSPSGLTAAAISSSQINLSWTDNSGNETGFKIERKTGSGGTYQQVATAGANITAYSDTGLTAGTTYYYRVRAYNANGDSAYSNEANAATLAFPPTAATNAATNVGFNSATLNATVNPNGTETTVYFQWGTTVFYGNTTSTQSIGSGISDVSVTANLTGLSSDTTYHYRVVATNPGGTSYGDDRSFTANNTIITVITGGVIDSSTGLALSNVSIIIVDSLNKAYTTMTDSSGAYRIPGITPGSFTATFMKTGYAEQILNGTLTSGQTLTLDVQLTPYALSFEIIKPTNAYNPGGWVNPLNGFDNDENTYSYKNTPNSSPSISFGGSSSNNTINAWQSKSRYWFSALLYITFERLSSVNDSIEIVITDKNGNVKHTILNTISGIWPKREFVQKLNMFDWGDGFNDIANLRVRVNGLRVQGSDNAESRVYDVRIEGNTSPSVKDYTRGFYSMMPNNDNNLTTNYTPAEIINVDLNDESRVSQEGSATQILIHQFKRKTPSHNMTLTWNGQINKAGVEAYAQSFKPNTSGNITAVRIFFKKVGAPNGSLRVRIKSELGGNVITESNVIAETSLVLSGSWKTFTFINPALVTAGNTYYIEIWRNKDDVLNYPQVILKDCSSFTNLDNFYWWRSNGSWSAGLQGPILFETDINNTLDVSTGSCYSIITPERNITGLDLGNIYLEIYNRTTSSWVQLDTDLYDGSLTDINLLGTVSSNDYFDQNGWLSIRVYTTASNNDMTYLATDLIDFSVTSLPAFLTGTVTNLSTGLPVPNVTLTVTDSLNRVYTTTSNTDGTYSVSGLSAGNFTAIFEKSGYITQTVNSTLIMGETKTLNIQLIPIPPLTIAISSPQNGAVLISSPLTVTGNVSNNANVTVNGVQASVSNSTFSVSISLSGGQNTITAVAVDSYSQTATQSINVTFVTPPVVSNMTVSNITTDLATITWTTDQLSNSLVEYGTSTSYGSSASDALMTTSHNMTLTNLASGTLYHFKVTSTNTYGVPSSSGDNTFTTSTPSVSATTIGSYGNVTVMEVTGNYDAKNPDGSINTIPRQDVAKEFLRLHPDQYDFMVIFSNFDFSMPETNARAFYLEVKNSTQGIGKLIFNNSDLYGSTKLQGTIDMGNISNVVSNPIVTGFDDTISTLAHEQMHRWGASIKFRDAYGNDSTALQGKDGTHWNFLLDSEASVLYGNDWKDNGDGTFTSTGGGKYYSPLDLYLAGFYDSTQVPQMLLIDNPLIDATRLPEVGTTISGTAKYVMIDNIITAEGDRIPSASTSQKNFKTAFILVTRPGTFNNNVLPGIETIRNAWAGRFTELANGKGTIMDITPSISITIGSPSGGASISGSYVDVKGAVINTTGNETGVTVNGVVATVYGTQFIADNVPLTEGSNTITVTATDTAANTSSTSITVNAVTTGGYIKLSSNIESGIVPLEITLKIDGSFSITNSNLNITGPAQPIILSSSADEYRVKFIAEGVYYITASATDSLGYVYQDTIAIMVLNKTQLDSLLKGKWEGMKGVLGNQDVDGAVGYFGEQSRERYRAVFNALLSRLPQIASGMENIQLIYIDNSIAKYRIRRTEAYNGQPYTVTYYIYFNIGSDGLWKIDKF
jgi:transcriptional regulator CtsR